MGNQTVQRQKTLRARYRTLDTKNDYSYDHENRRNNHSVIQNSRKDSSFIMPSVKNNNHNKKSFDVADVVMYDNDPQQSDLPDKNQYQSLDISARYRKATPKRSGDDKVLQNLSKKNLELRKELKRINDELSKQLKKKKLVPKKNMKKDDQDQEYDQLAQQKQNMGLKRQLQNGYKQIEMYKRTIENLKGRDQSQVTEYRLKKMQNDITDLDKQHEKYSKRLEAVIKVKDKQENQIEKDINDDLKNKVIQYKNETQNLKSRLKVLQAKDRARQSQYKKQLAYLCDLNNKKRELNGQYFPDLKSSVKKQHQKTSSSDRVNPRQFYEVQEEARLLKIKHDNYYKKIDTLLLSKNKIIEQQNDLKQMVLYKQRIIEALKIKIDALKKLAKARRQNLFGYDNTSQMQSEYNQTPSQLQRQIMNEISQDQFDIKHLIANIPKPVRKRPQQISNGYSSEGIGNNQNRKGMIVTNQKAAPKKWGAVTTRTEERGRHFKGQLAFEDRGQFEGQAQPLIVGLNVWVDKNNGILALQAVYLNKDQTRYGVKSADAADGALKRFDVKSPDYLKNLTLTMNHDGYIESMTLYSRHGKVVKFGNKRASDQHVNFDLASSQRPFMLSGASTLFESQPRITSLAIQICND